jgi:hypothetical protein
MLQSRRFKYALIRAMIMCDDEQDAEGWVPYKIAMDEGYLCGIADFGMPPNNPYSTRKNARADLVRKGLLEQKKDRGHFYLRLTELGRKYEAKIPGKVPPVDESGDIPQIPFRIGAEHMLPAKAWKNVVEQVKSGHLSITVDAGHRHNEIPFWDDDER